MFEIPPSAKSESWIYRVTLPDCNPFSSRHKLQLLRLSPKIAGYFSQFQQAIGTAHWYPMRLRIEPLRPNPTGNPINAIISYLQMRQADRDSQRLVRETN